jgi:hypothetical protein
MRKNSFFTGTDYTSSDPLGGRAEGDAGVPLPAELVKKYLDTGRMLRARSIRRFLVTIITLGLRRPPF